MAQVFLLFFIYRMQVVAMTSFHSPEHRFISVSAETLFTYCNLIEMMRIL